MDQPLNSSFDPMHDDDLSSGAIVPIRSVAQEQEHRKRIQKLVLVCLVSVGVVVAAFFIGRASKKSSEPDSTQWVRSPWSTCSEKCGGGVMTRTVFCANGDGDPVPSDLCPTNEANPTQLACNTQQCSYDFVVVGGGSAGCVMAARLSEDATKTVLLLESGGPSQVLAKSDELSGDDFVEVKECRPPMVCDSTDSGDRLTRFDVPYYWMTLPWTAYRRYTWNYTGLALGEVLGGSGAINAMIYVRGIKQDFDDWVAAGNPGWTWETALNYYKKTENNTDASIASDTAHHSTTGPMHVSTPTYFDLAGQLFTQAATTYGIPHLTDFNGADRMGVGNYQFNKDSGVRDSTLRALLGPALQRGNLEVRLFSRAMKINFAGTTATGVTYMDRITGESITVGANKEVILTAGAVNTAKLLLLSGVGDQGHLAKAKIPLVLHAPGVGQNLHDHTSVNVVYDFPTANYPSAYIIPLGPLDQYAWSQTGLISSSILATGAFVRSPYTVNGFPDIQFTVWPKDLTDNSDTQSRAWSVSVTLNRPISRGNVTLNTSNPTGEPILSQINLLEQIDIDALVWGIKTVREIVKFAPLNTSLTTERSPGAQYQSDSQLAAFIQQPGKAVLGNHWVGSAKMGPASDPMAVIDSNLLVRGLTNVRVADASMTPAITNGNIHATVIMCAERAADLVKSAHP